NQVELLKEQIADLQYRNSKLAAKHSASLNALEEFSKIRKTEMQREELLQSLRTISMEEELRKTKIGLVNSVATANIKEFQRQDFEHESKRLKLDILSNTVYTYKSQIEKYKLQLRNCKEQIGDYEDKVEKLQKANIQVSKDLVRLQREHDMETKTLIEGFKQKAKAYEEKVRKRLEESQEP
ncbi:hypothetical protein BCV72DRAFT_198188, partial [Rhizopus microsporus var. microsporus]